jgi:hypothetical protein
MKGRSSRGWAALGVGLGLWLGADVAHANSPAPETYMTQVVGNLVYVCPWNFAERGCPDAEGMLREDTASGAVVKLATSCVTEAGDLGTWEHGCYVDECVPPGTYRYGYATPYECEGADTYWYREVEVTQPDEGCERTAATPAPAPADGVPWSGRDDTICSYHGMGSCSAGGRPAAALVFGAQALALVVGLLVWRRRRGAGGR